MTSKANIQAVHFAACGQFKLQEELVPHRSIWHAVQVGGIYFGKPRGFGTNEKGERIGYNTMVYSESEVCACDMAVYLRFLGKGVVVLSFALC